MSERVAVVTGASTGIGAETARALANAGFNVVLAARRQEKLEELAKEIDGRAIVCDVTSEESVRAFATAVSGPVHVLINNAGGARGLDRIDQTGMDDWQAMYELNVVGVARVTKAFLPHLRASGDGHIVIIGSTAGFEVYEGGGGYTASKHAVSAFRQTLRLELWGEPIRVSEIAPGMVHTEEFSLQRFGGDVERAAAIYAGVPGPLVAEDVADAVAWTVTRPSHVNVDFMVIRPRAQAARDKLQRVE